MSNLPTNTTFAFDFEVEERQPRELGQFYGRDHASGMTQEQIDAAVAELQAVFEDGVKPSDESRITRAALGFAIPETARKYGSEVQRIKMNRHLLYQVGRALAQLRFVDMDRAMTEDDTWVLKSTVLDPNSRIAIRAEIANSARHYNYRRYVTHVWRLESVRFGTIAKLEWMDKGQHKITRRLLGTLLAENHRFHGLIMDKYQIVAHWLQNIKTVVVLNEVSDKDDAVQMILDGFYWELRNCAGLKETPTEEVRAEIDAKRQLRRDRREYRNALN